MAKAKRQCEHVSANGVRCERKYVAAGLCRMHYERRRHGRKMDEPLRRARGSTPTCTHVYPDGVKCGKKHRAKGLCSMHHKRRQKGSDMDAHPRGDHPKDCAQCGKPARSLGLCELHYRRMHEGRDMEKPLYARRDIGERLGNYVGECRKSCRIVDFSALSC